MRKLLQIVVLSDTRVPTLPEGGHGLGRVAWDVAQGMARRGYAVRLLAGLGSAAGADFEVITHSMDETRRAALLPQEAPDIVFIDLSHQHDLSRLHPDWPVVNWVVDLEVNYTPPNAVVCNAWQQQFLPAARIVPVGVNVDAIPFIEAPVPGLGRYSQTAYLAFCHKITLQKGYDIAQLVGQQANRAVHFAGENLAGAALTPYHGPLAHDDDVYEFIGLADALLSPCRADAGGRVNLEAAALGTPVLTLDWTGTACHVEHCVSGFVCADVDELVEAVRDIGLLKRAAAREWVADTHSLSHMIDGIETLAQAMHEGERW